MRSLARRGRAQIALLLAGLALGAIPFGVAVAHADDAPSAEITIVPWASHDGVERPYRYIVTLRPHGTEPLEVVADRRLLELEVRATDSRRTLRCRHPRAQTRVSNGRVRTLTRGRAGEDGAWQEWIDLRMYCTGRALDALLSGAEVSATYGWRRATRSRWVARAPGATAPRELTGRLTLEPFLFAAHPEPDETTTLGRGEGDPPSRVRVSLANGSASTGAALSLRVAVRAREGTERVYVRPDSWSFRVDGPLGRVTCRAEPGGGSPPPDLYQRITTRRRATSSLDADFFCPEGTFELAGVYEITPKVRLPFDGSDVGLSAVAGRFSGSFAIIRILSGDRGYLEQVPVSAETER